MYPIRLTSLFAAAALLPLLTGVAEAQQIYKWIDASGQVHYGEKQPENAAGVQALDIAPPPAAPSDAADSAAEIARINALSEQMSRERQAAEQARQEQTIRNLEQENQQLQKDLLNQQQQQQQQNDTSNSIIIGPPSYPYPPYPPYPPRPYPPHPCQPWPDCYRPSPPPRSVEPPKPSIRSNPTSNPKPVGVDSASQGVFRGR